MPYSLLSRFQGGLGGSAMGGVFQPLDADWLQWDQVQTAVLSRLVQWPAFPSDVEFLPLFPPKGSPQSASWLSGLALGLLPLLLWEYEAQPHLPEIVTVLALRNEDLAWLSIWAIALHEGLRGQLPDLPQWRQRANADPLLRPLTEAMGDREPITPGQPPSRHQPALPFALHCVAATPEDPQISIHRAHGHSPLAAALTATLMGIYHGVNMTPTPSHQQEARQLFARWAGQDQSLEPDMALALAPGGLLSPHRPRPLVSQIPANRPPAPPFTPADL